MTETYDFEKLARDIVASRLSALAEQAPAAAAEIPRGSWSRAQKHRGTPGPALDRGGGLPRHDGGLLFINQDLAKSSARILKELDAVSQKPICPSTS